jgi:GNAT superfamily N-acetyltransferase
MPKDEIENDEHADGAPKGHGISGVALRRFDPAFDSEGQLTKMLHRAFARLGAMGLNCTCVDQATDVTLQRAMAGECFVALSNDRPIGTLTLCGRDTESPCEHYHRSDVASLRQFGIDPPWQSLGIGRALLSFAEQWALTRGYSQLALDTPHPASHLLAFYRAHGFRIVDMVRYKGKVYDSAILSKPLAQAALERCEFAMPLEVAVEVGAPHGVGLATAC